MKRTLWSTVVLAVIASLTVAVEPAFAATTYSFTSAGASGRNGPTQAQINTAYTGTTLAGQVTINTQGIQLWTVPAAGSYQITAVGAGGGGAAGGNGASMTGTFSLSSGTTLKIVVGQTGVAVFDGSTYYRYGGGGGSYVTNSSNTAYIVAGGGGGAAITGGSYAPSYGTNGSTVANPSGSLGGVAGTGSSGCGGQGQGGGGLTGNGTGSPASMSFTNNSVGGSSGAEQCPLTIGGTPYGGFGGGGAGGNGGGGGGGYYGGTGGDNAAINSQYDSGDGGGSYNSGNNQSNVVASNRNANGSVTITFVGSPSLSISAAGSATQTNKGQTLTLTANAGQSGLVTFFADGKRIPGCISLSTSGGNVNCIWKATIQKYVVLTANLVTNGSLAATAASLNIKVNRRSSKR